MDPISHSTYIQPKVLDNFKPTRFLFSLQESLHSLATNHSSTPFSCKRSEAALSREKPPCPRQVFHDTFGPGVDRSKSLDVRLVVLEGDDAARLADP